MKLTINPVVGLLILMSALLMLTTGCPQPAPPATATPPDQPVETQTEPVVVDIPEPVIDITVELTDDIEPIFDEELGMNYPRMLVFNVDVEYENLPETGQLGIHFNYEETIPTGEFTYLREDPRDPTSPLRQDENGDILFAVVETEQKTIESWDDFSNTIRQFSPMVSENAMSFRYWVDVVISKTGGEGEEIWVEIPYATIGDVVMQGGVITDEVSNPPEY